MYDTYVAVALQSLNRKLQFRPALLHKWVKAMGISNLDLIYAARRYVCLVGFFFTQLNYHTTAAFVIIYATTPNIYINPSDLVEYFAGVLRYYFKRKLKRGQNVPTQKNNKGSDISISLSLILLLVGFILGVSLSPKVQGIIPQEVLTRFGMERRVEPVSQGETAGMGEHSSSGGAIQEREEGGKENKYTLQIAAFSDIESALGLADTLNTRGYAPYIQISDGSAGISYLLRLGFWTSEDEARDFAEAFEKNEEMKSSVVNIE
jgi:Sporulation related domain.